MVKTENWLGFDAIMATFDANRESRDEIDNYIQQNQNRIDIASIINYDNATKRYFIERGFIDAPIRVTWKRKVEPVEQYIKSVKKGRDMQRGINLMQPGKRYGDVSFKLDYGLQNDEWYNNWFSNIFVPNLEEKERPRMNIRAKPEGHIGFYAFKDDTMVGGRLVKELPDRLSASYSMFQKDPKYLNEVAFVKMMEEAKQKGKQEVSLGVDVNFYGYHLNIGIMKSKLSFGFEPYYYRMGDKHLLLVLNRFKFGNPFMFFGFINGSESLINNVFVSQGIFFDQKDYIPKNGIKIWRV